VDSLTQYVAHLTGTDRNFVYKNPEASQIPTSEPSLHKKLTTLDTALVAKSQLYTHYNILHEIASSYCESL
jgi:hypothetical protein